MYCSSIVAGDNENGIEVIGDAIVRVLVLHIEARVSEPTPAGRGSIGATSYVRGTIAPERGADRTEGDGAEEATAVEATHDKEDEEAEDIDDTGSGNATRDADTNADVQADPDEEGTGDEAKLLSAPQTRMLPSSDVDTNKCA